jgi:hypothetical protein
MFIKNRLANLKDSEMSALVTKGYDMDYGFKMGINPSSAF